MTLAVQGLAKKLALVFSMSLFLYRQRGRGRDWNWPCSSARLPFCPGISRQGGGGRETGPGVQRVYLSVQVSPGKGEVAETETGPGVQRVSLSVQVSPGKGEVAEKLALVFRLSTFLSRYLPARGRWQRLKLALVFSVSPFLSRYLPARERWQRNWPWCSDCLPFCPGISRQGEVAETETGPGVQRVSLSVQVSPGKGEVAEKLALVFRLSTFLSRYLPARGSGRD